MCHSIVTHNYGTISYRSSASSRAKATSKSADAAEDNVDSPSSEETERYGINDAEDSSVRTLLNIPYVQISIYFSFMSCAYNVEYGN